MSKPRRGSRVDFFFTLVTGSRRSLSLKLSDTRVRVDRELEPIVAELAGLELRLVAEEPSVAASELPENADRCEREPIVARLHATAV